MLRETPCTFFLVKKVYNAWISLLNSFNTPFLGYRLTSLGGLLSYLSHSFMGKPYQNCCWWPLRTHISSILQPGQIFRELNDLGEDYGKH